MEAAHLTPWMRGKGCCWIFKQAAGAMAMTAGGRRSGPQSWEVTHLLLDHDDGPDVVELLDKVAESATHCGAERLFLRLRSDDPLVYECRHAGFVPCLSETMYRGRGIRDGEPASGAIREKRVGEEYALFRLYNAATPSEVRSIYGMTFDQWRASRERYLGQTRELVLERDGVMRAWVETRRRFGSGHLAATVHPDEAAGTGPLLRYTLPKLGGAKKVFCLVPQYDTSLRRSLKDEGFEPVCEYSVLARLLAVGVTAKAARAPATIASA